MYSNIGPLQDECILIEHEYNIIFYSPHLICFNYNDAELVDYPHLMSSKCHVHPPWGPACGSRVFLSEDSQ